MVFVGSVLEFLMVHWLQLLATLEAGSLPCYPLCSERQREEVVVFLSR